MEKICVAPGEMGQFKNWGKDTFLEEMCFPHLFPYGIGGYLSSCLATETNIGFAVYCRHQLRCADPKFRNDQVYIFFLLLVKELIEMKRCKQTYFRQARKTPDMTRANLHNMKSDMLTRYNRGYSVFKNMRGTTMYYEAAKRDLMATLRQKGAPTLFLTLSAAEYQWEGLLSPLPKKNRENHFKSTS